MIRKTNWKTSLSWGALATAVFLVLLFAHQPARAVINLFGGDEEPLPVDVAFVPEIADVEDEKIIVDFDIADGYYLYRDKLQFTINAEHASPPDQSSGASTIVNKNPSSPTLADPVYAEAIVVSDDFFGEQAIFRQSTRIEIPYALNSAQALNATLSIKYQGCSDIGLCYPPTTTTLSLALPGTKNIAQPTGSLNTPTGNFQSTFIDLNSDANELLLPEQAFLPRIANATDDAIDIKWIIEDGYYLYRDKISFTLEHPDNPQIQQSLLSEGTEQTDEFFGDVHVLRHTADAFIRLANAPSSNPSTLAGTMGQLTIDYQGCADIGVCFPPAQLTLPVNFIASQGVVSDTSLLLPMASVNEAGGSGGTTQSASLSSTVVAPAQSEQDRLSDLLGTSTLWITVATFFGLGLLLAFTPCVLPMIPILSSLIVGQGKSITTGRAFQLSLVYVLVMAGTYAAVGVVVGLSGYNVQAFLQNPYVLSGIAVLFVLLSLSMFGFYELQMPAAIQSKLTEWSNKQGGGQFGGVAAMGFISTLIVGPCVTAPLAGALIYIAKTGDALMGGAALFALGLGMGAPLLLIGTSAGKLVPKAGAWMDATKHIFGILMLAMAVYMISRFLPTTIIMGLYGVLAVMSGVYLGATDSISRQSTGWQRFGKGAGLVVALYGIALLVGALAGGNSYTTPLRSLTAAAGIAQSGALVQNQHSLNFQRVKSVEKLQEVVAKASAQGRPVMLDFYADWCISCKEMEAFTFTDSQVQALLNTAIVVQADVTANDAQDQAMLKQFNLFGPPGIIFYDARGNELPAARVVGFMNAKDFSAHVRRFLFNTDT